MLAEADGLIQRARDEGLVVRRVGIAGRELVFFKSVLEAYPGIGVVVAARGAREVTVVGARGCDSLIDELIAELAPPGAR